MTRGQVVWFDGGMETNTTTDTGPGTLFLDTKGTWLYSVKTECGFRHIRIGKVNNYPTKDRALAQALILLNSN